MAVLKQGVTVAVSADPYSSERPICLTMAPATAAIGLKTDEALDLLIQLIGRLKVVDHSGLLDLIGRDL